MRVLRLKLKIERMVLAVFILFLSAQAFADTIYLKNGHTAEGLISREDGDTVVLSVGYGTVIFKRDEIKQVVKSTPQEAAQIKKDWTINTVRNKQGSQSVNAQTINNSREKWGAIIEELEIKRLKEEEKRQVDANAKEVPVVLDKTQHLVVESVLNGDIPAQLVVDTGCPDVFLTAETARRLGIDLEKMNCVGEATVLNGKHRIGVTTLKLLKLAGLEEKDIEAEVMLEDNPEIDKELKGGLLGLSFLNRYDVSLDQTSMKLIFKKPLKADRQNERGR